MVESGLGSIAHNLNRRNHDLRFFEFGKTYHRHAAGQYDEQEHLCLYITGHREEESWRSKTTGSDLFVMKGVVTALLRLMGVPPAPFSLLASTKFENGLELVNAGICLLRFGAVSQPLLDRFDIKQPVLFADFNWPLLLETGKNRSQEFREIPRFPSVQRDLAIVVPRQLAYEKVEQTVQNIRLNKLQTLKLFDIFESEKLGAGKKSMAINFTFLDEEKTLTDKEIENWMNKIIHTLETELQAEIRK